MDYKVDPPDDVWVDYALPWIEGRCIPKKRLKLDGDRWIMQYSYPKPEGDVNGQGEGYQRVGVLHEVDR